MIGIITKIVEGKNFGFIKVIGSKHEYFFHKQDYIDNWNELEGDMQFRRDITVNVEFDSVDNPKGPRAGNVRRIEEGNR